LKAFDKAVQNFENYLSQRRHTDHRVSAYYWLYRANERLRTDQVKSSESLQKVREDLFREFPLSYFALRLWIEKGSGVLKLPGQAANKKSKQIWRSRLWLTPTQQTSWLRFKDLIEANWYDEAQIELASLPEPKEAEGLLTFAFLWALALDYQKATETAARAWAVDRNELEPTSLALIYVREFQDLVISQSQKYKLSPEVVLSLIRQESQFRPWVESRAGALGLMQILPSTGRELARDFKLKNFNPDRDLRTPEANIKIGTNYIHRRIRTFSGHLALALASYNAGVGNVKLWLKSRKDLSPDQLSTEDPDSELWMDEMPWSETTGYVRNILRNIIVYRFLANDAEKFSFPLWSESP